MPDAKSLLPGRAFRSEHAQLRPEPHSIASHGPDPMDPLQTTRMRNGVLYAAEWPCCHDPLRLSLGSEDPFSTHAHAWRRTARFPPSWAGDAMAVALRAPPPRAGRRAALARLLAGWVSLQTNTNKPKHLAPARRSFGQRPWRVACASRAWEASSGCADDQGGIDTPASSSRGGGRGGARASRRPPHPAPQKAGGRRAPLAPPTHALIIAAPLRIPPPPELPMPNQEHCVAFSLLCPWDLHKLTPAHSPSPLSTPTRGLHIAPM